MASKANKHIQAHVPALHSNEHVQVSVSEPPTPKDLAPETSFVSGLRRNSIWMDLLSIVLGAAAAVVVIHVEVASHIRGTPYLVGTPMGFGLSGLPGYGEPPGIAFYVGTTSLMLNRMDVSKLQPQEREKIAWLCRILLAVFGALAGFSLRRILVRLTYRPRLARAEATGRILSGAGVLVLMCSFYYVAAHYRCVMETSTNCSWQAALAEGLNHVFVLIMIGSATVLAGVIWPHIAPTKPGRLGKP